MSQKYDVIVIGAGIGGLTAAAILARNGKKVLVLEKMHVAGGYAVNFRRGDFNFDASLHMIDGCGLEGEVYNHLRRIGITDKIEFIKPPYLYRSIFPDFDIKVPQQNIEAYLDILVENFPGEGSRIKKLFDEMSRIQKETTKFIDINFSSWLEKSILPLQYRKLFFYQNKTWQYILNKFLTNNKLKTHLSQIWCYYGLPPSTISAIYYAFPSYNYWRNGGYYPRGGSGVLSKALCDVINQNGGEVKLNSEVTNILIKHKKINGVRIKKENEFFADVIISNIDASKTFFDLVGEGYLSKCFINKIKKLDPSISAFQVYLGLNTDLKTKGISDYEIFCNPNYDIDSQYSACFRKEIEKELFSVTLYSNIDSNAAPEGKSVVGITTLSGYDFWNNLAREEYKERKHKIAEKLINATEEKIIPNLSSYIEKIEIATPLTMERYTGNQKGAIYGCNQITSQSGIRRLYFKTPIKNLYLASAWTWLGGGISSVIKSGCLVAKDILRKAG